MIIRRLSYVPLLCKPARVRVSRVGFGQRINLPFVRHKSGNPAPSTVPNQAINEAEDARSLDEEPVPKSSGETTNWKGTAFKMFESAMTTFASITILGLFGYSYNLYYKHLVLEKMEHAFEPGDPVLELVAETYGDFQQDKPASEKNRSDEGIYHCGVLPAQRPEQDRINKIVSGLDVGHYHLIIGEKGTGKSSMLLDAMARINGEGCAMLEAHADIEIFRIRLGKALDFEYHEDNIGSLFSIRGPRDASALLDIERAFNKLEKVALNHRKRFNRPLVLIINSVHLLRNDDDGRDLLELIQQRAELWAASKLCTVVMNSDDYWVYERLKGLATRMQITAVSDLNKPDSIQALKYLRYNYLGGNIVNETETIYGQVYDKLGGRLSYLRRAAQSENMLETCEEILRAEEAWFLNQCWVLGEEMDDDVMDQQKYASAAMVLAKALVDLEEEKGGPEALRDSTGSIVLPQFKLHEARYVMTRADFIQSYDHLNVFTIDSKANVRADSVPMMHAFRNICTKPGFDEHLEKTLKRINDIESLGRTRELTIKDLWDEGSYRIRLIRSNDSNKKDEFSYQKAPTGEIWSTFNLKSPAISQVKRSKPPVQSPYLLFDVMPKEDDDQATEDPKEGTKAENGKNE